MSYGSKKILCRLPTCLLLFDSTTDSQFERQSFSGASQSLGGASQSFSGGSQIQAINTAPIQTIGTAPIQNIGTSVSPIQTIKTSPIQTINTSPIQTISTSPIQAINTAPIQSITTSPILITGTFERHVAVYESTSTSIQQAEVVVVRKKANHAMSVQTIHNTRLYIEQQSSTLQTQCNCRATRSETVGH